MEEILVVSSECPPSSTSVHRSTRRDEEWVPFANSRHVFKGEKF
jgi:hypothetical protein